MTPDELRNRIPLNEIRFSTSRSGGPGGQNINKVNTKVELRFDVKNTIHLTETEKEKIFLHLKNRINSDGILVIKSQSERTQYMNKKRTTEKFFILLASALTEKRIRKSTTPTSTSIRERLETKKMRSTIKKLRKDKGFPEE
ncbi:MAG TPA: aminoacyl-tRNA hydrolase [Bacteroidales bacterium]|nr:aminoacyl-tRNA hydrolase [Bacteroidales bacterium]